MGTPLKIEGLRVRSLNVDLMEVTWRAVNTLEDVLDYTFQVLRSESSMGPFDELTPPFEDRYLFIDNNIKLGHSYRKYFYTIRVTRKRDGESEDFGPATLEADPDLLSTEIRKHMNLLFREHAGRRCWVLPIRTFGQRCQCWSATLGKRSKSGCRTCYDTGFTRGYMHPIESWVQFDPSPKSEQQSPVGVQQQSNTTARMGYFPDLKPRDLIIESENRRWRVVSVSGTEHLRSVVHQELQLHEIPKTDVEYAIELQLQEALKDMFMSPARAYTNPQNMETFEREEIPSIMSLYPSTYGAIKT
jgi:hypothetical protein